MTFVRLEGVEPKTMIMCWKNCLFLINQRNVLIFETKEIKVEFHFIIIV